MAASFVIEGSFAMLHRLSTGGLIAQVQKIVATGANKGLRDRSSHRARITARTAPVCCAKVETIPAHAS
jgi:hypothetical protein